MEVEATHINHIPKRCIQQRDFTNLGNQEAAVSAYSLQKIGFPGIPMTQPVVFDSLRAKTTVNTDSGLTCNIPAPRKRYRESMIQFHASPNFDESLGVNTVDYECSSFFTEDILPQIQQSRLDTDTIISQHTKKIRLELENRQKQHERLLVAAIGEQLTKKLKQKDEHIQKLGKLSMVLQERVKTLCEANQTWRDLARTNEATANSLRANLERALAQVGGRELMSAGATAEEDAESCCIGTKEKKNERVNEARSALYRRCRRCGERESCVLLLPCRHLCLCDICGSGSVRLQACPVCNSSMNASLHVNMSS